MNDLSFINQGRCFLWAYLAYRLYSNIQLWDIGAHAFVRSKKNKRFYDAEHPKGVSDWRDLKASNMGVGCGCPRCQEPPRHFATAGKFRHCWRGMAKHFDVDYQVLHQQIKLIIEEKTK